jgi:hypothetical protein
MPSDEKLVCPIHGEVEGLEPSEGPLSQTNPWALVCEKCDPHHEVIVGWNLDAYGVKQRWEDFGEALI